MTPTTILGGVLITSAFLAGAWMGRSAVKADWDAEKASESAAAVHAYELNAKARDTAEKALANVQSAVTAALRRPNAPLQPVKCPPSGNALDAVVPGLGDRLRSIDAAASGVSGAGVAVMPGAGPSNSAR